jgi:hypothetical protein
MFFPRTSPLRLTEKQLFGLRRSLNAPILGIESFPPGPARAAILTHEEADGRPNLTVAVRSESDGVVALFSFEGDLYESTGLGMGIDAALCFAESMGFLFDDDELGPASDDADHARALRALEEFIGSVAAPAPPSQPPPDLAIDGEGLPDPGPEESALEFEPIPEPAELLLSELAPEIAPEPEVTATEPLLGAPSSKAVPLTKFRAARAMPAEARAEVVSPRPRSEPPPSAPPADAGGGRVSSLWLRILSAF